MVGVVGRYAAQAPERDKLLRLKLDRTATDFEAHPMIGDTQDQAELEG